MRLPTYPGRQSVEVIERGFDSLADGSQLQRYQCKDCRQRFNERSGTPIVCSQRSLGAPSTEGSDATVKGDEVYTRMAKNLPPPVS